MQMTAEAVIEWTFRTAAIDRAKPALMVKSGHQQHVLRYPPSAICVLLHPNKRRERFTRSNRQPVYRFGYAVNM
jgi:hypothetical protein